MQLPFDYSDLPASSQLAITVWDLSPAGPEGAHGHHIPFGGTTIPLFDDDGTLKKGRQRCHLWRHRSADPCSGTTTPWFTKPRRGQQNDSIINDPRQLRNAEELDRLQDLLKKHEMGDLPENKWLDQMVFRQIERMERANLKDVSKLQSVRSRSNGDASSNVDDRDAVYVLHIEFPRFDHPILFADKEYPPPPVFKSTAYPGASGDVRLKPPPDIKPGPGIDTNDNTYGEEDGKNLIFIYDPEVGFKDNPAETKHRALVRGQRSGLLDKHLKPNPRVRDTLNDIMSYGPTRELATEERDLVWKFRHHLRRDKRALTKLVKSVSWNDAGEVKQVIHLLPKWEEIDVDDALELLGPQFDNADLRAYAVSRLRKANDDVSRLAIDVAWY